MFGESVIGTIALYAGATPPKGWLVCDGRVLLIKDFTGLHYVIQNAYGGDNETTFALPDLRGRIVMGANGTNTQRATNLGATGGEEANQLTVDQLPYHSHHPNLTVKMSASGQPGTTSNPAGNIPAVSASADRYSTTSDASTKAETHSTTMPNAGAGKPVDNMASSLVLNYIICVEGTTVPIRS